MSKTSSAGSFDVEFKTETAYTVFGLEYARCYANLGVRGEMSRPAPLNDRTYRVRFQMQCGCDTVLGEFKKAYDKTFENKDVPVAETDGAIDDRDFRAWMQVCTRDAVTLDAREDIARAHQHFPDATAQAVGEDPPYVDKDGLVQFIIGSQLSADGNVMTKVTQLADYLIACTSIVTNYVNNASKTKPELRFDPQYWYEVSRKLPLFGPSKLEQKTYSNEVRGIEIAGAFLNFIMDAVATGDALGSFKKFLADEGNAISMGVSNNKGAYRTITNSVVTEAMAVGKEVVYLPKLKMYYIEFTRENYKVSTSCGSYERIKIDLKYTEATALFDYKALDDPVVKKDFDDFIQRKRKAQIQDADTFFQDDFDVEMPGMLAGARTR